MQIEFHISIDTPFPVSFILLETESYHGAARSNLSSSTEAKYVALNHSSKDILWIHKILSELSLVFKFSISTVLHCDNQGAIWLSKDLTFHACTKHINVHFYFIRQTISSGQIILKYCPTNEMVADIFTKSLPHRTSKVPKVSRPTWIFMISSQSWGGVL